MLMKHDPRIDDLITRALDADMEAVCRLGAALLRHSDEGPLALLLGQLHLAGHAGFDAMAALARHTGEPYSALVQRAAGPDALNTPIVLSEAAHHALQEQLPKPSLLARLFKRS